MDTQDCCICFECIKTDDLANIECQHQFHFECIEKWSLVHNVCPLCKADFKKIETKNKMIHVKDVNKLKKTENDERGDMYDMMYILETYMIWRLNMDKYDEYSKKCKIIADKHLQKVDETNDFLKNTSFKGGFLKIKNQGIF